MLLKIISKKYADEILDLLAKHNELYFGQILNHTGINPRNLSDLLKELEKENMVIKTEKRDGSTQHLKKYYSITLLGRKILYVIKILERLPSNPSMDISCDDDQVNRSLLTDRHS